MILGNKKYIFIEKHRTSKCMWAESSYSYTGAKTINPLLTPPPSSVHPPNFPIPTSKRSQRQSTLKPRTPSVSRLLPITYNSSCPPLRSCFLLFSALRYDFKLISCVSLVNFGFSLLFLCWVFSQIVYTSKFFCAQWCYCFFIILIMELNI